MTTIRLMTDDDLDAVTDLWDQHVSEVGGGAFDPDTRMRIFSALCRCLPAVDSVAYVADQNGTAVGFVVGTTSVSDMPDGKQGLIEELYVIPAHRRQKIGTSLVNAMSGWLQAKGANVISVQTPSESDLSTPFWSALGWEHDLTTFTKYEN